MKTFSKFLTFGAMAALMSACSNDNVPDAPGAQNPTTDGGYLAVNIQLPTEPSTRAANDDFNDGETYEYGVSNAAIVLFQGANEADATFVGAYVLVRDKEDNDSPSNDNITVSHQMVAKISNSVTNSGKLYALALVNYTNGIAEVGATDGSLKIGGEALTPGTSTFKDLLAKTSTDAFYAPNSTSNFFMTNAPLCTVIGGSDAKASATTLTTDKVFTLANFKFENIKQTRQEAIDNPAADIYVERAVAKVTMAWKTEEGKTSFSLTDRKDMTAELVGWTVNNTESSSYIVRNLGFNPKEGTALDNYLAYTSSKLAENKTNYRFVGHSKMGTTATLHPDELDNLYRTYWCIDPHYTTDLATSDDVNTITDWTTDVKKAFYPHENTFCVANQNFKNTTRVLLKVKINVTGAAADGTFYKMNDVIYAKKSDIESYAIKEIVNDPNFQAAVEEALEKEGKKYNEWTYTDGDLELTYETDAATGKVTLESVAVSTSGTLNGKIDTFNFTSIIDRINLAYETYVYTGGICYYDLKIMHFASNKNPATDLAPWTAPDDQSVTDTKTAYGDDPKASQNYLGRYGLVRNNWYDINVTGVADVGSPVVPNANLSTSDDNNVVERFIAFKIHILSWAKRTNNYILK